MRPLIVYYHLRLTGGNPPVAGADHPANILRHQMKILADFGLLHAATRVIVGINNSSISEMHRALIPAKCEVLLHGDDANTECPTLHYMQKQLDPKTPQYICYFHAKGARNNQDRFLEIWRDCMQHHIIEKWGRCVADLDSGVDSVGCHWLTPEAYGPAVREPFWGGNYWWATSEQLATLPPIPANIGAGDDYFTAERWFGWGKRPRVIDYAPHWPNATQCAISSKS